MIFRRLNGFLRVDYLTTDTEKTSVIEIPQLAVKFYVHAGKRQTKRKILLKVCFPYFLLVGALI